VWDLNNGIQSFEENDVIKIDALVITYNNEIQLNIKRIRRAKEGEYDPMELIPSTDKDVSDLFKELTALIDSIENEYIKTLLENVFIKNESIGKKFKMHSAAKAMHHNYMGGLIEHTLSVAKLCDYFSSHYEGINRDLLVSTALLHDIGKLTELSEFPTNDYTDEGQLLGHIFIGAELITEESGKIEGFPEKLKALMKHSILAHHGELEYGSPKRPKTKEAFLLHCADDLDAKMKMYESMIEQNSTSGNWAGYNKMLGRYIRNSEF
ncbi:MAG: HD domain-containing protein, partial [Firmicutes bacterium]|nr:HD domain-containing protein [Bacillota bacterium]